MLEARALTSADVPVLTEVIWENYTGFRPKETDVATWFAGSPLSKFGVFDGEKMAGFALCEVNGETLLVKEAGLLPPYRTAEVVPEGLGLLKKLAEKSGCKTLRLEMCAQEMQSIHYLLQAGMSIVRHIPNRNGSPEAGVELGVTLE
jgi:hypothetical protein